MLFSSGIPTRIWVPVLIALLFGVVVTTLLLHDEILPVDYGPPPNTETGPKPNINRVPVRDTDLKQWGFSPPRVSCTGPRGLDLGPEDNDDNVRENTIDIPYPRPFVGSHETLGLSQTWMTAADRYGPYGWGEDEPTYRREKVAWNTTNWSKLQNQCLERNARRFKDPTPIRPLDRRFRKRKPGEEIPDLVAEPQDPRYVPRTAVVFRAFEGYNYTTEDLINLRATTAETALRFGGEYTVFIMVDVKDKRRAIFASEENYRRAVQDLVPPEFQDMAVLFDETVLQSWYPGIQTHITTYQVMQPLQLFGHFYPEFDHYWQLEVDLRFTGHAGRYLSSMSDFARRQPRKQSMERSTWFYMQDAHGSYSDLTASINATLDGGGGIGWNMQIDDFEPIGPRPPVEDPQDDPFSWGVGEEADFIAVGPCAHVQYMVDWAWRNWYQGLKAGTNTPRWMCQPAMGRASKTLLRAAHHGQSVQGLAVHSEATLSSFALWHGLKLVAPPHPLYQDPQYPLDRMNELYNGPGSVEAHTKSGMVGMAHGQAIYKITPWAYITTAASFWYTSQFPDKIYDAWLSRGSHGKSEGKGTNTTADLPYVLWRDSADGDGGEGAVYAPNMMLHPVKTNHNLVDLPAGPGPLFWVAIAGGACVGLAELVVVALWWRKKRKGVIQYVSLRRYDED
ncbi:uncharacterized protein C8A04DRAFT_14913 [Dichotomopilus funicola]|uniref:Uncharacterized protein n=1 Tax=Dichotomopilus funicola TaxID=1934379 RepID=A0AAN6UX96_9PEZI|nr:hypothetical protein C8A04DRAFT_14913 [Dichotomopilus funicola]